MSERQMDRFIFTLRFIVIIFSERERKRENEKMVRFIIIMICLSSCAKINVCTRFGTYISVVFQIKAPLSIYR